jgi:hypothetical protein
MSSDSNVFVHIQECLDNKSTGALFLKLSNEQLLQLFFIDGQMQSMKYHGVMGLEVIDMIASLEVIKSQFHDGAISRIVNQLPNTADIIQMMKNNDVVELSPSVQLSGISPNQIDNIGRVFISFVGPIGDMIFREEIEASSSKADLVNRLSQQLDESDRSKFESEVS